MTSIEANYNDSKIMLCTLHSTLNQFKEDIRPKLPENGLLLLKKGSPYGVMR